jgi:hypothetical protein
MASCVVGEKVGMATLGPALCLLSPDRLVRDILAILLSFFPN